MSESPDLRASDADRERAADTLRQAAGEGRLTVDELEARLHDVYAARTQAELADDVVELTVFSFMGGADIRVPDGLNVEVSDVGILGGNDVEVGDERPDPGGPLLRLRLISIMGGSDVKRGRRLSRAERRALRRSGGAP